MTNQAVLEETVRAWVEAQLPACGKVADQAAATAGAAYAKGASVTEACQRARSYVLCWARHPANQLLRPLPVLREAATGPAVGAGAGRRPATPLAAVS